MVPDPAVEPNGTSRIGSGAGSVQARNEWIHSVHWILVWIGSGGRKRSRAPERGLKVRISEPIPTGRGAVPPSHRYISHAAHHDFVRSSSSAPVTHETKPIVRPLAHRRQTPNPSESAPHAGTPVLPWQRCASATRTASPPARSSRLLSGRCSSGSLRPRLPGLRPGRRADGRATPTGGRAGAGLPRRPWRTS